MKFLETFDSQTFRIALDDIEYSSISLGQFLCLEKYKRSLRKAIKHCELSEIVDTVENIVRLVYHGNLADHKAVDILRSLVTIINHNGLTAEAIFLKNRPDHPHQKPDEPELYDYEGRFYAQWIDMLAAEYGWSEEAILGMNFNRSAFYMQEILIRQFHKREWEYRLSELAYQYDPHSKKSKYVALDKPLWMTKGADKATAPKTTIHPSMLPYGVENISGYERQAREEYEVVDTQTEETS